ncbi:TadE/TadG family type IV pilus assembly protein [Nocardioides sp. Kera G14]|uniref:TadE/TadG family type IV pilus assembly protein n=1 Tax=Nocardioides sp. Kera G14 TaxID=2884264 RepID=UPI001D0F5A61|nr:TadE/TadG family type IV pilus assembly protein [Nocardioides sp. Kera G14]UDY22639.1 pilus assembly protein [Nocardioides sp. Kera G14]
MDVFGRLRASWRRPGRAHRGAAAVEFGLVVVPFLLLVFGILQYGMYLWAMQAGTSAAGDAVRRLAVGDCRDATQLHSLMVERLGITAVDQDTVSADVVYRSSGTNAVVAPLNVQIGDSIDLTLTFRALDLHLPLVPMPSGGEVTRQIVSRVEDTTSVANGCL